MMRMIQWREVNGTEWRDDYRRWVLEWARCSRCSSQAEEVASDRKGIYHPPSQEVSQRAGVQVEVSCYDSLLGKGKQKTKQDQLRIKEKRKDRWECREKLRIMSWKSKHIREVLQTTILTNTSPSQHHIHVLACISHQIINPVGVDTTSACSIVKFSVPRQETWHINIQHSLTYRRHAQNWTFSIKHWLMNRALHTYRTWEEDLNLKSQARAQREAALELSKKGRNFPGNQTKVK